MMNNDSVSRYTLDPKVAEEFSRRRGEPGWMMESRLKSLAKLSGDQPALGRYSKLNLDIGQMQIGEPSFEILTGLEDGTLSADGGGHPSFQKLSGWAPSNEDFLWRPIERQGHAGLLSSALWSEGIVFSSGDHPQGSSVPVLVPKSPAGLCVEPLILDIKAGASSSLAIKWGPAPPGSLRVSSLRGRIGDGAKLRLSAIREGGEGHDLMSLDFDLGKGAEVELFCVWLGGKWTVVRGMAELSRPGSSWKETHISWTAGREHLDIASSVEHSSPDTRSDVQLRSALSGMSRTVFAGNIGIKQEAVRSDAYLADKVLLLSKDARSDMIPGLVINAMDVKAAHAASCGEIDEDQLLYLQARGMDPEQAKRLLVKGFLSSLSDRAPSAFVSSHIDQLFEDRVSA